MEGDESGHALWIIRIWAINLIYVFEEIHTATYFDCFEHEELQENSRRGRTGELVHFFYEGRDGLPYCMKVGIFCICICTVTIHCTDDRFAWRRSLPARYCLRLVETVGYFFGHIRFNVQTFVERKLYKQK